MSKGCCVVCAGVRSRNWWCQRGDYWPSGAEGNSGGDFGEERWCCIPLHLQTYCRRNTQCGSALCRAAHSPQPLQSARLWGWVCASPLLSLPMNTPTNNPTPISNHTHRIPQPKSTSLYLNKSPHCSPLDSHIVLCILHLSADTLINKWINEWMN